jgi:hypothetical protein
VIISERMEARSRGGADCGDHYYQTQHDPPHFFFSFLFFDFSLCVPFFFFFLQFFSLILMPVVGLLKGDQLPTPSAPATLVFILSSWLPTCQPHLGLPTETASAYPDLVVVVADPDVHAELARGLGVATAPACVFMLEGQVLGGVVQGEAVGREVVLGRTQDLVQTAALRAVLRENRGSATELDPSPAQGSNPTSSTSAPTQAPAPPRARGNADGALMAEMMAMGYSEAKAFRALSATNSRSIDEALSWIEAQDPEVDLDAPISGMVKEYEADARLVLGGVSEQARAREAEAAAARLAQEKADAEAKWARDQAQKEYELLLRNKTPAQYEEELRQQQIRAAETAERMKREKAAAEKEKEAIRNRINQDKADREARRALQNQHQQAPPAAATNATTATPAAAPASAATTALVQFRLPDGRAMRHSFSPDDAIGTTVYDRIAAEVGWSSSEEEGLGISLVMALPPRKAYNKGDATTLREAGLVPNGNLNVLKRKPT